MFEHRQSDHAEFERVKFRPSNELARVMEEEGLGVEIVPAWGKTPFSNVLLIGTRQKASGLAAA